MSVPSSESSSKIRSLVGLSGWLAAAAAVAWAVSVCRSPAGGEAVEGAAPESAPRTGGLLPDAAGTAFLENGAETGKSSTAATAAAAGLSRRLVRSCHEKDFAGLMGCLEEALASGDPKVRLMMAAGLSYYASYTSLPAGEAMAQISLDAGRFGIASSKWLMAGEDDMKRLRSVLPAAERLLDDSDARVRKTAAEAFISGLRRMDARTDRLEATRNFFADGNAALLDEFRGMSDLDRKAFTMLNNNSKEEWARMLSDAIEHPADGDHAALARSMYSDLMSEEYSSAADTEATLGWLGDMERLARERYDNPEDVAEFMTAVSDSGRSSFDDRARELFEQIQSEFGTAHAALNAAMTISRMEKAVMSSFGEDREAEARREIAEQTRKIIAERLQQDLETIKERQGDQGK